MKKSTLNTSKAIFWLLGILLDQYITEFETVTSFKKGKYQFNSQLNSKGGFLVRQCCRHLVRNFRIEKNEKKTNSVIVTTKDGKTV